MDGMGIIAHGVSDFIIRQEEKTQKERKRGEKKKNPQHPFLSYFVPIIGIE